MRIYICGPLTLGGTADRAVCLENSKPFWEADRDIREQGHQPINPLTVVGFPEGYWPERADTLEDWRRNLRTLLKVLVDCDAVYLIPGWPSSPGSRLEVEIAEHLGLLIWR